MPYVDRPDPQWITRKEREDVGVYGTFSKPLPNPGMGDPYSHKQISKFDPMHALKKAAVGSYRDMVAPVFDIAKMQGPTLHCPAHRPLDKFKPLGGAGGAVPKRRIPTDDKWTTKMRRSPHKFFGSSNMEDRGDNNHNIKQIRMSQAIAKENYNLGVLMKMRAEAGKAAKENSSRAASRASTRAGSRGPGLRSRANTVQGRGRLAPLGENRIPLVEADPQDKLYSTQPLLYDNILNPSTRYVDGESSATTDSVCPKCAKDTFFCPHTHDHTRPRKLGHNLISSSEIGMGSLAALRSLSPPRRPFKNKPGVATGVFGGDLKTEQMMACRSSPPPRGAVTAHHSDRWK